MSLIRISGVSNNKGDSLQWDDSSYWRSLGCLLRTEWTSNRCWCYFSAEYLYIWTNVSLKNVSSEGFFLLFIYFFWMVLLSTVGRTNLHGFEKTVIFNGTYFLLALTMLKYTICVFLNNKRILCTYLMIGFIWSLILNR